MNYSRLVRVTVLLCAISTGGIWASGEKISQSKGRIHFEKSKPDWTQKEVIVLEKAFEKIPGYQNLTVSLKKVVTNGKEVFFQRTGAFSGIFNAGQDAAPGPDTEKIQELFSQFVFERLDEKFLWSDQDEWLSLNRWKKKFSRWYILEDSAHNDSESGFIEKEGKKSPRKNLAVFLSRYLQPRDEDETHPDSSLKCLYLPQARFAEKIFSELEPGFVSEPARRIPSCPAFNKWADAESISHFEIILASPSPVFLGSLFGHVFLRAVQFGRDGLNSGLSDRTFGFMAETFGLIENDPFYNFKGIFGLYKTVVVEKDFSGFYRQYVVSEDRDMQRWRLNLNPEQKTRLLERLWTLQRTATFRYYFFTDNCGTLLFDLIRGVLAADNIRAVYPDSQASLPTATIDGYLQIRLQNGQPLLTSTGTIPSYRTEMSRAREERNKSFEQIYEFARSEKFSGKISGKLSLSGLLLDSSKDDERKKAYDTIANLAIENKMLEAPVKKFLALSSSVESYRVVNQNVKKEKEVNVDRVKSLNKIISGYFSRPCHFGDRIQQKLSVKDSSRLPVVDHLLARCRLLENNLKNEDPLVRIANYRSIREFSDDLTRLADSEPDREIARDLGGWRGQIMHLTVLQANVQYDMPRLTATKEGASLLEDYLVNLSALPEYKAEYRQSEYIFVSEVSEPLKILLPYTGYTETPGSSHQPNFLPAISSHRSGVDAAGFSPLFIHSGRRDLFGVQLMGALIDEQVGDQRISGFPFYTAMRLLHNNLFLAPTSGDLFYRDTFTIIDLRMLQQDPGFFRPGFEILISADFESPGLLYHSGLATTGTELRGGLLFPLARSSGFEHYLLMGQEVMFRGVFFAASGKFLGGLPFFLEGRIPLGTNSGISFARLKMDYMPAYDFSNEYFFHVIGSSLAVYIQLSDYFVIPGSELARSLRFFLEAQYQISISSAGMIINSATGIPGNGEFTVYAGLRSN